MRILLDTHTLLWYAAGDQSLSQKALQAIDSEGANSLVSAVTLWEIAIKVGTGKLSLGEAVGDFWARHERNGVELLPVNSHEVLLAGDLPFHHRDPFDRLLIAQSIVYRIPIVCKDAVFDLYGVDRFW